MSTVVLNGILEVFYFLKCSTINYFFHPQFWQSKCSHEYGNLSAVITAILAKSSLLWPFVQYAKPRSYTALVRNCMQDLECSTFNDVVHMSNRHCPWCPPHLHLETLNNEWISLWQGMASSVLEVHILVAVYVYVQLQYNCEYTVWVVWSGSVLAFCICGFTLCLWERLVALTTSHWPPQARLGPPPPI